MRLGEITRIRIERAKKGALRGRAEAARSEAHGLYAAGAAGAAGAAINAAASGLQLGQNATGSPNSSANIQQSSADTAAASTSNSNDVQNSTSSQRDNATQDVRLSSEGLKKLFGL